ncbi:acetyl-CoA carboxylase carboxyltransferase subunit alpha [Pseudomonas sp.]|uniref:acetyl-CoA carboxylase carboxyltransferase subunit alpha n=1 Tax=Pseudomonas sp. TaxID=306 RepID=UPI002716FD43|nr:acetyl-CoA carboxylase carboxyltransferase subunit alpha [Pseudomonas sp.]MDO8707089.1 acetyl-CoA carboxylase carboxyltransferase subunit alpha [Pseudomonas sp.]
MIPQHLDFEKPIAELERKIEELRELTASGKVDFSEEIKKVEKKVKKLQTETFSNLTKWQKVLLSRHINRPYTLDYLSLAFTDFIELHGDRNFKDDPAIVGGLAKIEDQPVMVIGQQKGRNTKEKIYRNFGMPHPEGYRKALRLMRMAERFGLPIVTFIDTPGAYPGLGAEERGQAEAIAKNLREMAVLKTPIVSIVIGEGGSGGALAIGVSDKVLMMEYATYSVISPEGCAAILWSDGTKAELAAEALKITADDLVELGVIDGVVKEPVGGAHRNYDMAAANLKKAILDSFDELKKLSPDELTDKRYDKFRKMGMFIEG